MNKFNFLDFSSFYFFSIQYCLSQVRKRRSVVTLTEPVDRTKVTIKDLIYLNPNSTPMK